MSSPIQILIADDHPVFRSGLRSLLDSYDDISVVGEAATGGEAIALADLLQPDIVLMDVQMPEMDGLEATSRILDQHSHIRVLMLTMVEADDAVFGAMRLGARGYLLKSSDHSEIVYAVRKVMAGEKAYSPPILKKLTAFSAETKPVSTERGLDGV